MLKIRSGWPQNLKSDRLHFDISIKELSVFSGISEKRISDIEICPIKATIQELNDLTVAFDELIEIK